MKRIFRVTLDYCIDIDESSIPQSDNKEDREYEDRQRRLLHAILSNNKRLSQYLRYEVASSIICMSEKKWYSLLLGNIFLGKTGDVGLKKLLQSSLNTLSVEDRAFFDEAERDRIFFENVEQAVDCFSTTLEKITMEEQEVQG